MSRTLLWRLGAALVPAAFGVLGLLNGLPDWRSAGSLSQHIAAAGVILYGPLGLVAAGTLVAGHRSARPLLVAWALAIVLVAGVAPVAWGDAPPMIGILSAFSSAMLMAAVLWAAAQGAPDPPREAQS